MSIQPENKAVLGRKKKRRRRKRKAANANLIKGVGGGGGRGGLSGVLWVYKIGLK